MTPEEKLLRAIFGEKASDVRDTSLRLPPGVSGTVVDVRVFNRHGIDKDERAMAIEREEIDRLTKDREDERAILNRANFARLREMLLGQVATAAPKGVRKGATIDDIRMSNCTFSGITATEFIQEAGHITLENVNLLPAKKAPSLSTREGPI